MDSTATVWMDTHCHIQSEQDPLALARQAFESGVVALVCVGTDVPTSHQAIGVVSTINNLRKGGMDSLPVAYSTVGLHPHDAANEYMSGTDGIAHLLRQHESNDDANIVAIGECGLDYFYDLSPRPLQQAAFRAQIRLAKDRRMALVIHTRDSWDDTFAILEEEGPPERFVFHCFTGDRQIASKALAMGAYLSFSGMVTFKSADSLRDAAIYAPLDRIVVETDSPFLAPVPHRGKANAPAHVVVIGEFIAKLRKLTPAEFSYATNCAARECFRMEMT